ncbi:MAG: class I SAM-dependent methyltransferase [Planctomycetaceae bacterium]|nr:class I SAM-dependent methyltransferase [Planctomycetaceae bacterium]
MNDSPHLHELRESLGQRFQLTQTATQAGGRELTFYHPSSVDDLLDEEAFNRDGRIPYWSELWPAARVLADWLVRQSGNRQRTLELGCGVGCGAIAATIAGFDVTASDYYAEALDFVRLNALSNQVAAPQTMLLDWRAWPTELAPFDVVIAADVLYEPQLGELVAAAIDRALRPGGWALVTDPQRRHIDGFLAACRTHALQVTRQASQAVEHRGALVTTDVYRIDKRE